MTYRSDEIWKEFCGELIVKPTDDMKEALASAIRACASRLYTDCGELQLYSDVLYEIADELEEL